MKIIREIDYYTCNKFLLLVISFFTFLCASFASDISYPEQIDIFYSPQPFDDSWAYNILFDNEKTVNPTYTGQSLNKIINMDIPETQNYYNLYNAREKARLAYNAYEKCTAVYKFDKYGNINFIDSIISAFSNVILSLGESGLSYLFGYNDILTASFGYRINRDEHTYTTTDEEGNEITRTSVDYSLSKTGNAGYVNNGDSGSLINLGLSLLYLSPPITIAGATLLTADTLNEASQACKDYGNYYYEMWSYLYDALLSDIDKAEQKRLELISAYENASFAGMCNTNYTFYGLNECIALKEEILALSSNGKELYFIKSNITDLKYADTPRPENIFYISSNVKSFSDRADSLIFNTSKAQEKAKSTINEKIFFMQNKNEEISAIISRAEQEKLYLIDAVFITGNVENTKNVNLLLEDIKLIKQQLSSDLSNVYYFMNSKPENYLLNAYLITKQADKYSNIPDIMLIAKQTVDEVRARANEKINELNRQGYETKELRNIIYQADTKQALGDKYALYVSILNKAVLLQAKEPEKKDDYERLYYAMLDLIRKAKEDGIETTSYESMLSNIHNSEDSYFNKYNELNELKQNLMLNVKQRFSSIQQLKNELDSLLRAFPYQFSEIALEKKAIEGDIFYNGIINYEKGLGNLNELENFYKSSIARITKDAKTLFNSVPLNFYVSKPRGKVDEQLLLEAHFFLSNPYQYKFENVEKQLPLSIDLYSSDYSLDRGHITTNGKNISWIIPYIESFETLSGKISKLDVFAISLNKITYIYSKGEEGKEITNMSVDISADMLLDIGCECNIYIGSFYAGKKQVIDMRKGRYNLSIINDIKPVRINKEAKSCVNIQQGSLCKYSLDINALENIDKLEIQVENNATITDMNMQQIKAKNNIITLENLKKNENVRLEVSYLIQNASSYLNNIIAELEKKNLTGKDKEALDEIKAINRSGFYNEGIIKALNLNETITKKEKEQEDNVKLVNKTLEFYAQLDRALSVNSSIKDDLIAFNNSINDIKDPDKIESAKKTFLIDELKLLWTKFTNAQKDYYNNSMNIDSLDSDFSEFESLHRKSKISYNLEDLSNAAKKLDEINAKIKNASINTSDFDEIYKNTQKLVDYYGAIEKKAKELKLTSYLPFSYSYYKEKLNAFEKLKTPRQKQNAMNDLKMLNENINETIGNIAAIAEKELSEAEQLLANSNINYEFYKNSLEKAKRAFENGDYMSVLSAAKQMKDYVYSSKPKINQNINWLPYIAFAAVAFGSALYLYRDQIKKFIKRGEKPKKIIRSYEDIEKEEQEKQN